MTEPSNQYLVEHALPLLPSNNREAARVLGVSEGTLRRWKSGVIGTLRSETRSALRAFLTSAAETKGDVSPSRSQTLGKGDSEVGRRVDTVESLDLSEREKAWKIAEIAAAYRAKALADLAAALEREARVAELQAAAASASKEPTTVRDESARRRELVDEAVRTKKVPQDLVQGRAVPPAGSAKAQRRQKGQRAR